MTRYRYYLPILYVLIISTASMAQDQRIIRHIIIEDCQNIESDSLSWSQFLTEMGKFEFQEKVNGESHLELGQLSWRWFDKNRDKFLIALLFRDTSNWNYLFSLETIHETLIGTDSVLISDRES